jgi:hypothetical protein
MRAERDEPAHGDQMHAFVDESIRQRYLLYAVMVRPEDLDDSRRELAKTRRRKQGRTRSGGPPDDPSGTP